MSISHSALAYLSYHWDVHAVFTFITLRLQDNLWQRHREQQWDSGSTKNYIWDTSSIVQNYFQKQRNKLELAFYHLGVVADLGDLDLVTHSLNNVWNLQAGVSGVVWRVSGLINGVFLDLKHSGCRNHILVDSLYLAFNTMPGTY